MQKKPIHSGDDDRDSWAEDQRDRGYYYDDSHGYEAFDPDHDEGESDQAGRPDLSDDEDPEE